MNVLKIMEEREDSRVRLAVVVSAPLSHRLE